nr:MAG TPA: hypothetical protein [Caudoviricetes sp.]
MSTSSAFRSGARNIRDAPAWLFPATKGTATPKPCRWPIARRSRKVTCRPTLRS